MLRFLLQDALVGILKNFIAFLSVFLKSVIYDFLFVVSQGSKHPLTESLRWFLVTQTLHFSSKRLTSTI